MKKLLILSFLLVFSNQLFSQNWNLIHPENRYHYFVNDEHAATIRTDSIETNGNDTTFYLNRIAAICDTCANVNGIPKYYFDQPNFLQKYVVKEDSVYRFHDTVSFAIMPYKLNGQSWLFDTTENITATIGGSYTANVLGQLDSIKTIGLSNGQLITISKNFGIIDFNISANMPFYNLSGIQGKVNIGYYVPTNKDFYNYEIGDFFGGSISSGGLSTIQSTDYFFIITDTVHTDSTLQITTNECHGVNPSPFSNPFDSTVFYTGVTRILKKHEFFNHSINEVVEIDYNFWSSLFPEGLESDSSYSGIVEINPHSMGKSIKYHAFLKQDFLLSSPGLDELQIRAANKDFELSKIVFEFGTREERNFIQNMPVQEFSCEYLLHNIPELEVIESFKLHPNPSSDNLNIERLSAMNNYDISIIDLSGKQILSTNWESGKTNKQIDITKLETGSYLIQISEGNKIIGKEKFVKID